MRLILSPPAEADIADAYFWYESQQAGLGAEFLEEVSSAFAAMNFESLRFPAIYRTIRRALIHRFPYGIFFVVSGDELAVVAVLHLARDPRRMRARRKP